MCESTAPLCNLLAANREGILGCIGYLSIYLTSYYIGRICLWNNVDNPQQRQSMLYEATAVLWLLAFLLAQAIPVSRRSTNVTFCVWTLAHNTLLLALLEAATSSMTSPPIFMNAMNRHGLLVFVVANLLTGLVNLTFDTLHASDAIALVLLTMYLSCVCGFAVLLDPVLALLRHRGRSKTN
jgi:phosphatidylinositol glycan class W